MIHFYFIALRLCVRKHLICVICGQTIESRIHRAKLHTKAKGACKCHTHLLRLKHVSWDA